MIRLILLGLVLPVLVSGCLLNDPAARYQPAVEARIGISTTTGDPPLHVVVSAEESVSTRGPIVKYTWDFAGLAQSNEMQAEFTFTSPGRYTITLTVVDSAGEQASAGVYVRVRGGPVTAVINADPASGPAPLLVHFDGTQSTAVDDTILDYFWDFGDAEESREAAPTHRYDSAGTYTVTLRAVSNGGVEGTAQTTIEVGPGATGASLQFNGSQLATLPVTAETALSAFTFEAWCNPDGYGGTLVDFGLPPVAIELSPTTGTVGVRLGGQLHDTSAPLQPGHWQHVAVSYWSGTDVTEDPNAVADPNTPADPNAVVDPNSVTTGTATVYVDGTVADTVSFSGTFNATALSLGFGFRGKIARVRFWSVERSSAEIAAGINGSPSGSETGLLGDWPLSDGSGQMLRNNAQGGQSGTLGMSDAAEPLDPAWSADSP